LIGQKRRGLKEPGRIALFDFTGMADLMVSVSGLAQLSIALRDKRHMILALPLRMI
jgi:hypothetical protein